MRCKDCNKFKLETVYGTGDADQWCQCPRQEWEKSPTTYTTKSQLDQDAQVAAVTWGNSASSI